MPDPLSVMASAPSSPRLHYAWIMAATTFAVLLVTAGVRATPSLFLVPLQDEFGWSRTAISGAVALNIALFGLIGPFAASFMNQFGLRRVVMSALSLLAVSVAASTQMTTTWQLVLLWGVLVGAGTGVTSLVLAALVATRWFDARRGVVLGALSAANATGQLIFLPTLARLIETRGWRSVAIVVSLVALAVLALVWRTMRNAPSDLGLRPYGQDPSVPAAPTPRPMAPLAALAHAARTPAFWVLAATFFVCGASTNGLIGTHLVAACHDVGITPVRAAGLLAMMGVFDIIGTTASGWLTDRWSARHLLFTYYTLRGLALLALPATLLDDGASLSVFAVFYGLDWIATVPPTVKLTTEAFGREDTGVIYGWIGASHQLGASAAAFGAGALRESFGDYRLAFVTAGVLCVLAGLSFLTVGRRALTTSRTASPMLAT